MSPIGKWILENAQEYKGDLVIDLSMLQVPGGFWEHAARWKHVTTARFLGILVK